MWLESSNITETQLLKHSTHGKMSKFCFLGRADLDTGTIVEPSIAKLVVSEIGSSKLSGRSSDSSNIGGKGFWRAILLGYFAERG